MKVTRTIAALFVGAFILGLTLQSVIDARRETNLYDQNAWTALRTAAQALQASVGDARRLGGEEDVRRLLGKTASRLHGTELRWVWLDARSGDGSAPRVDPSELGALDEGRAVEIARQEAEGRRFYLYAPAERAGRKGAIEASRSLSRRRDFLVELVGEQAIGVLAGLVLAALPCVLLLSRYLRRELSHQAGAGVVTEATRRMADLEELHHANRLVTVGRLAASMVHELGTPLAVVQARAQMIAAGEVAEQDVRADAELILQQTTRMTQMVHDMLLLARQKTGLQVPLDLAALARQTAAMIEPLARTRHVTVKVVGDAAAATAVGDPSKLLQILTNLTMNATQAMPDGGAVTLAIGKRRATSPVGHGGVEADYLFVEVRDEGLGIAPHDLPRIFDSFFTTKKEGEGMGLGLSVSYRIARGHGGWIAVQSQPGEGSCFTLYLPSLAA